MRSVTHPRPTTGYGRLAASLFAVAFLAACGGSPTVSNSVSGGGQGPGPTNNAGTGVVDGVGGAAGGGDTGAGTAGTVGAVGDVGFSTVTRLNRDQYNNTVRDLLGTQTTPANTFPPDELALGFNTIARVLRVQPEHIERYLPATEALIDELFARAPGDPYRGAFLSCDVAADAACAGQSLTAFANAAWRRPVDAAELAAYATLATTNADPVTGLKIAMRAVLMSPHFIYRIELDPNVEDPTPHALSGHEFATRLSYALWGTMPDAALRSAADAGQLVDAASRAAQVERLLADPRGAHLITGFGSQWLGLNGVARVTPDGDLFAEYTPSIGVAMVGETQAVLTELLATPVPVAALLTSQSTYLNEALAAHYGIAGVTGETLQQVSTEGTDRIGLLTQGSYLTSTSNSTRTSPVKRGLFVLDRLLCAPPPPPPPTVVADLDGVPDSEGLSVREKLEVHVQKGAECAACHVLMDQIGLGLENFDAVGRFRAEDEFGPIDATGVLALPGAAAPIDFEGAAELAGILSNDARLPRCFTDKFATFALGRSLPNGPGKTAMADQMVANGASFRSAVEAVVGSVAFTERRAALAAEVGSE